MRRLNRSNRIVKKTTINNKKKIAAISLSVLLVACIGVGGYEIYDTYFKGSLSFDSLWGQFDTEKTDANVKKEPRDTEKDKGKNTEAGDKDSDKDDEDKDKAKSTDMRLVTPEAIAPVSNEKKADDSIKTNGDSKDAKDEKQPSDFFNIDDN